IPQGNNMRYMPHAVLTPFSPDYDLLSQRKHSSFKKNRYTNHNSNTVQTHTNDLTTSGSSNIAIVLEEEPSTVHTHSSGADGSNSSPHFYSILELKPVNTPFYFAANLLGVETKKISNHTHYFELYNLSPFHNTPSTLTDTSLGELTSRDQGLEISNIEGLPAGTIADLPIDVNDIDNDHFASSDKEGIMSRYNQQLGMTRGFHIGSFASAHNNWILNPALKDYAFSQNSNLIHQLDFGHTYGLAMGYEFSDRWGVQVEWVVNSEQGQKFAKQGRNFAASNSKTNTDINLNYTYFPVLLKYRNQKMFSLTKQPLVINYIAGIQYGMLKSAEINIENPIVQEDLLQLSSWGFVWGLDYDFYLNKNYFLTFGARTSLSTSSDAKNKPVFPTTNTSNRLLIGLRASFNYHFK
ncbi:MAG: hypothetical protein AB8B69_00280, partial [Chitinophagales bacterium]